jgi:hypothetical protein
VDFGLPPERWQSAQTEPILREKIKYDDNFSKVQNFGKGNQVKSKKRVADHGEVFTNQREVNAMLDLVKHETGRIDSRFLEPACGEGVFLMEVLRRKLTIVESRYSKSQIEFERYAFLAIASLYGIDILQDNADICRKNLFKIFQTKYESLYRNSETKGYLASIRFVLFRNIIHGDALTYKTRGLIEEPITFSEWSLAFNGMVQRRDYKLKHLLETKAYDGPNLFSDLGEDVFIPEPVKTYPLQSILNIIEYVQPHL